MVTYLTINQIEVIHIFHHGDTFFMHFFIKRVVLTVDPVFRLMRFPLDGETRFLF